MSSLPLSSYLTDQQILSSGQLSDGLLQQTKRQVAEIHSATSHSFAALGIPYKLRPLVCAIIAASNGLTQFKASYKTLVELLFKDDSDARSFNAKKSQVRRLVRKLREWQLESKITLCTIQGGGIESDDKGNDVFCDTEFTLVFLDAIAKALMQSPRPERMRAAVRTQLADMMRIPSFDDRHAPTAPTPEELQRRERKAAITMALKAAEKESDLHGDPLVFAERVARDIVEAARQKFTETPPIGGGV